MLSKKDAACLRYHFSFVIRSNLRHAKDRACSDNINPDVSAFCLTLQQTIALLATFGYVFKRMRPNRLPYLKRVFCGGKSNEVRASSRVQNGCGENEQCSS